jgi:N-acylneuraminate cytidylyltransferase
MMNNKKILAIIPARGGSKRLPKKNVLPLAGKPLIQWSIEAARGSKYIHTLIVSTDCTEIAKVAKDCGVVVPYLRSASLSSDTATSMDVIFDVLKYYEERNEIFDLVMLLQPTSPLRTLTDINKAIELLLEKKALAVVSVTECDHSPLWSNILPDDLSLSNFISDDILKKRSQDLPTYHRLNGAIYLFDVPQIKKDTNYLSFPNVFAFAMDRQHSVDIDDEFDFKVAEFFLK